MKVDRSITETFDSEYGDRLVVRYDNRGEPFRHGIGLSFSDGELTIDLFLERAEAVRLAAAIQRMYSDE